jgi:methyl-accepting chemotaxis protein
MADEFELKERDSGYEVVPLGPIKRLEQRVGTMESAYQLPQLQSLINQIIELIRTNQKLIDEIVRADNQLRNELSRLPSKIDELVEQLKAFMNLVRVAGEEQVSAPSTESMKPLAEKFDKLIEQNRQIIDNNKNVLEAIEDMGRKAKTGTPVSELMSRYPNLKLRRA